MNNPALILYLEDDPRDAELVRDKLRQTTRVACELRVARDRAEYEAALAQTRFDLILSDYSLPDFDGMAAVALARAKQPDVPFILISGTLGEEQAVDCVLRGATDYLLKQRLERLVPAVLRALTDAEEHQKRRESEAKLRESEAALRASEEQYRAIFELASVGIAQADPRTGQWMRVNAKMCEITGYSADELLRMPISEVTHPEDRQNDGEAFQRVVQGKQPNYRLEKRYIRKDGSLAWVNVNMTVIRDAAGQPVRTVATIEDITERKRAEKKVTQLNAELEQRVRERTAELEAANKELEAFSYSVSHDLRAPLRAMDGFSMALIEDYADKLDETAMDHLRRIRAGSQRMAGLIDDLLHLSRVTRTEMRPEHVDLTAMAEAIGAELRQSQPDRSVEFVVAPALAANADPRLLRLALFNLIDNAWKFTSKHAQARIEVGELEKNGGRVFFVRDNGAGFDMSYVGRLFGAFQRLHTVQEFEGTGIGLAIVQRIVHRHGGIVWAEGAVGAGATVYFTLGGKE